MDDILNLIAPWKWWIVGAALALIFVPWGKLAGMIPRIPSIGGTSSGSDVEAAFMTLWKRSTPAGQQLLLQVWPQLWVVPPVPKPDEPKAPEVKP